LGSDGKKGIFQMAMIQQNLEPFQCCLTAAGLSTKRKIASDVSMVQLQSKVERNANAGSYQNYQNGALRKKN
jgi:hypothetical protein